jgi:hypothetical protein
LRLNSLKKRQNTFRKKCKYSYFCSNYLHAFHLKIKMAQVSLIVGKSVFFVKRLFVIVLIGLLCQNFALSQDFIWAKTLSNSDLRPFMKFDNKGNIISLSHEAIVNDNLIWVLTSSHPSGELIFADTIFNA